MDSIPRLETERLKLRAIFPADAREIFALYSDPKIASVYEFEPFENIEQAKALIEQITYWFQHDIAIRWAILSKESGDLLGTCCLDTFHKVYHSCNVGYNIRSSDWGKGFATEAVQAIIDYAFSKGLHSPINRIQAISLLDNKASERVLEKLGFQKEGLMREYGFWKGEYHDMNLYSLLNTQSKT